MYLTGSICSLVPPDVTTIFLPLSFYTGVWGMNFDDVPLLNEAHGFWIFAGLTLFTIGGMWVYFKKNKWI